MQEREPDIVLPRGTSDESALDVARENPGNVVRVEPEPKPELRAITGEEMGNRAPTDMFQDRAYIIRTIGELHPQASMGLSINDLISGDPTEEQIENAQKALVVAIAGLALFKTLEKLNSRYHETKRSAPIPEPPALKGVAVAGRGSTAAIEKGTTVARNLREQLAIEQAMGSAAAGRKLPFPMTDPRWPASEG
jgi:hypothetical protein